MAALSRSTLNQTCNARRDDDEIHQHYTTGWRSSVCRRTCYRESRIYSFSHRASRNRVKEIILKVGISASAKEGEQIELTPKQVKILEKVKGKGKITNKELQGMLGVSRQAVLKEISKLVDAGLIELVGKGRNAYYRFKDL